MNQTRPLPRNQFTDQNGRTKLKSIGLALGCLSAAIGVVTPALADDPPVVFELATLLAGDEAPGNKFGYSVAIDGNTAIISACRSEFQNPAAGIFTGSAYIFVRDANGNWSEQAKLLPSDGPIAGDYFGFQVDVSGDTAIIGAMQHISVPGSDDTQTGNGKAYIFVRDANGEWTEQQILTALDPAPFVSSPVTLPPNATPPGQTIIAGDGEKFGNRVAIDGDTAVVSAPRHRHNGQTFTGAVYVSTRDANGVWGNQIELLPHDSSGVLLRAKFNAVAISGDTITVGAQWYDDVASNQGAVFVFKNSGGVWTQTDILTASNAVAGDQLGASSVSIHANTNTIVAGAFHKTVDTVANTGSAYMFVKNSSGVWSQAAELVPSDLTAGDEFGFAVTITSKTVVIGSPFHEHFGATNDGAAYIFRKVSGVWSQVSELNAFSNFDQNDLGSGVAINAIGEVFVGASNAPGPSGPGAALVFDSNAAPIACAADLTHDGKVNKADLDILLGQWGSNCSNGCTADLNGDGAVDGSDLSILLLNYGPCS